MRRNNQNDPPAEDNWIWGNTRGGGGAPLRNPNGEPVANLRGVMNGTVEVDYNSPGRKGPYRDSPVRRGGNDMVDDRRYHSPIKGSEYSATRGLGHRNINVDDQERENRARKAREYQEQLREQVEEKKRQKEAEKREIEQSKQREYDDYIKNHYKGPPVSGNDRGNRGGQGRGSGNDDPPRDQRRKDDGYRERGYRDDYDERDRDRDRDRNRDRDRDRDNVRGGRDDRGDHPDRGRYPNERNHPRDGRKGDDYGNDNRRSYDSGEESDYRNEARWVSRREFEDLQRDYDQLKLEHEELANQLMLQEEIIEDLRRNQAKQEVVASKPTRGIAVAGKKGVKAPLAPAGKGIDKKKGLVEPDALSDPGIKSRAQSTRNAPGVKLPAVNNKKSRPSSMHDTPKASAPTHNRQEKKVSGVARGGEVSGFKKLQMGVESKRGGPVVVTFDDEEDRNILKGNQISPVPPAAGRAGGARQSHLPVSNARGRESVQELRGASEHFSIPSTDMDGISSDQLDRLLMKAKHARN